MKKIRKKVLLTVKAYPLPSRSYGELVCTAGVDEDGNWVRIYPVPLAFLNSEEFKKYTWIEIDLIKREKGKDFRPESHSPANLDLSDIEVVGVLGTGHEWAERRKYCLREVYTSLTKLWEDARPPRHKSLATFKPTAVLDLIWEEEEREWKQKWQEEWKQTNLFSFRDDDGTKVREMIKKVPYKFSYKIIDADGIESTMMIEDWEIGALYWNCLARAEGNESIALQKVKEKYLDDLAGTKDLHLFLGTTQRYHAMGAKNPFVIVGVFYPAKSDETQLGLSL